MTSDSVFGVTDDRREGRQLIATAKKAGQRTEYSQPGFFFAGSDFSLQLPLVVRL
jgi:hypothetical protein